MKSHTYPRGLLTLGVMNALFVSALALTATNLQAQSPVPWPTAPPYNAAICAFDKALTKAAREQAFRDRLTASCDSARKAVEEVGNVSIPENRIIIFFEPEAAPGKISKTDKKRFNKIRSGFHNERVHIFFLPPLKETDTTTEYKYERYFLGVYDAWKPTGQRCKVP